MHDLQRRIGIARELHLLRWLAVEAIANLAQRGHVAGSAQLNQFLGQVTQLLRVILHDSAPNRFSPQAIFFACVLIA